MGLTDEQYRKVMRKGWNLTVDVYDRSWVSVLARHTRGCVERARVKPGDRVLDVATGLGTAALCAAERGAQVLGTDISDAFVEAARHRAPNVTFERSEMESLRVADASMDVVLCAFGLMYAAPLAAALAEMNRVLVRGGRFAACVWGRREKCGFREVFPILGGPLQMDVCPLFFSLGVPGAFAAALEGAGFRDPREDRTELTIRWEDDDDACAAMFEGGPVAYPWSLFAPDVRAQVAGEYLASLAPYRTARGFECPAEFVFATAVKP
jgi:ubiquinone/menaquinone biosynthesis C-methylase UbiE